MKEKVEKSPKGKKNKTTENINKEFSSLSMIQSGNN
jgi:hypothetical protein